MFELIDTHPDVEVLEAEYLRLLGYPRGHALQGHADGLAKSTRAWYREHGRPWIYARQSSELKPGVGGLSIDGVELGADRLAGQFAEAGATEVVLAAVSAGPECEARARQLWQEEKPDEFFFMEAYGSAVVEHLVAQTSFRICTWADQQRKAVLPHYSPGYPGWDIADQHRVLGMILDHRQKPLPSELSVLDTGMLRPKKSLLAVFGITSDLDRVKHLSNLVPCQMCSLAGCQYRRVPYGKTLPQLEDPTRLQTIVDDLPSPGPQASFPLTPEAKYSLSLHALRKWSQERLRLTRTNSGSVRAEFRYDGTTCSNLGHPLEFLFHLTLGSEADRYVIEDATCVPAPTDTGHNLMCEYIDSGDAFLRTVADEKPLLGRPLDDVLRWKREHSPAGCFCESASREHKWGLVLEVVHFALTQRLESTPTPP